MVLEGTKSKAIVRATQWKSMASYKFIFDNDSRKTAEFFPRRRIVSLEQAGLTEKASDREIVEVASDRKWIIVTANGDHFIAEIKRYLRQSMKLVCHDLSGLVIVPNDYQLRRKAHRLERRVGTGLLCAGHQGWESASHSIRAMLLLQEERRGLTPLRRLPLQLKMAKCKLTLRRNLNVMGLWRRLAGLRLCFSLRLFISFRSKLLCHGFLDFLRIYPVAFGGVR